jgi:hypothetical protein
VQPDIRSAGPFIHDLLKTFYGWIVRLVSKNLGLKLERIRAWQREARATRPRAWPGMPVFPIQTIDVNIRNEHSLRFPCFTVEAHTELLSNEAMTAVRANQESRKNCSVVLERTSVAVEHF